VKIQSAGVVLTALLRLGLQAGLDIGAPPLSIDGFSFGNTFSSGAEVGIWLNLAEFITNVTVAPEGDANCFLLHDTCKCLCCKRDFNHSSCDSKSRGSKWFDHHDTQHRDHVYWHSLRVDRFT
jgi:hypothetical protein